MYTQSRPCLILCCWVLVNIGVGQGQTQTGLDPAPSGTQLRDLHGDPLPRGAAVRFGTVRFRPEGLISCLAFSPDGRSLLAGGEERHTIGLWSFETGAEILRIRTPQTEPRCAALSPDGKLIAIGSVEHTISIWDAQNGKELKQLRGHTKEVQSVAFAPDSKTVASASWDNTIRLWNVATGKPLQQFVHERARLLEDIAYSQDGRWLASHDDHNIWVWEIMSGKLLWHKSSDQGIHPSNISFSPRGDILIAAVVDNSIHAWNAETGKELFRLLGHDKPTQAVAFAPDGKTIASTGEDGTISIWDVATRKETRRIETHEEGGYALAFSPDGKWLALRSTAIRLWDMTSLKERDRWPGHFGHISSLTFSPDGRVLVAAADSLHFWSIPSGKEQHQFFFEGKRGGCVEFSSDGKLLAHADATSTVRFFDATTTKCVSQIKVNGDSIDGIAFSPDCTLLATTSRDNNLRLWHLESRKELRRWQENPFGAYNLTFSTDGRLLATVWNDEAHVLDVATGRERFHKFLKGRGQRVFFIPGTQTLLAIDCADFVVLRWDASGDLQRTLKLRGHHDYLLGEADLSPDGKLLFTAEEQGRTLTLYELATGEQIERFRGHRGDIRHLRFSPDGLFVATASFDTTILLWDITGRIDKRYAQENRLRRPQLDTLWEKLSSTRASEAYRAAWTLTSIPDQAVPFLAERVPPVTAVPAKRFKGLLEDLDSDSFKIRDRASHTLISLGDAVESQLRESLARDMLSVDVRKRIQTVLSTIERDLNRLRLQRVIIVLEYMHHPTAQNLLKRIARGVPEAQLTQEAKGALQRLSRHLSRGK